MFFKKVTCSKTQAFNNEFSGCIKSRKQKELW